MYPERVYINQQKIKKITDTFGSAYNDIVREIETATDFGVANRKAILSQIKVILEDLGSDVEEYLDEEMRAYYKIGSDEAVKQLKNVGAKVGVREGFNRVHKEAIAAIVDDSSRAFAETMSAMVRNVQRTLSKAAKEAITQKMAKGIISGEALRKVKREIKSIIREQGIPALVDAGGHSWTLDRYGEMLFRTKVVEARNRGLVNRMAENGYDLVQVSQHSGSCDVCADWEGKILSITGDTPGYETVADAEADGLFHPNCRHAINTLIPALARETEAYETD